jgi:hypothetical protein
MRIETEDIRNTIETSTNPVKAIRAKCLDCCCGQYSEVTACTVKQCALFHFRFGKNPYRSKRELSPEAKEAASLRFKNVRLAKASQLPV